jgi:hypothetical protein
MTQSGHRARSAYEAGRVQSPMLLDDDVPALERSFASPRRKAAARDAN